MKPWFQVIAGGTDITSGLSSRGVSLSLTDQSGMENDRFEITLEDGPPHIAVPAKGTELSVSMGYDQMVGAEPGYNGVRQFMGIFIVDETRFTSPPMTLKVTAHANDTGNKLKASQDKDYHQKTLQQIADEVAGRHGLTARVSPSLASKMLEHVDQPNQSDMEFMTGLARRHGAIFKVYEKKLILAKKGEMQSMSGQTLPQIVIHRSQCVSYDALIQARSEYEGAVARYFDFDKAEEIKEAKGAKEFANAVQFRLPSKDEAKDAAEARKGDLDAEKETLSFTCVGNPYLAAEAMITTLGFRPGIRTSWQVESVVHNMSTSGYTCDVSCKIPESEG